MINKTWNKILEKEFNSDYFKKLLNFVKEEYKIKTVYPHYNDIFNAIKYTDFDKVKVVILGQDPYHGVGEAHGLSFSIATDVRRPPSLNNIFKELKSDLNINRENNNLTDWAKQGVLLLNAIMTVVEDQPLSHKDRGWEIFTDNIIKELNKREKPIVFVLWGNFARSKKVLITNSHHCIIESPHPSPLSASRGFFGSKPFSKINNFLKSMGEDEIKW